MAVRRSRLPRPPARRSRLPDSRAGRALTRRLEMAGMPPEPRAFVAATAGWTAAVAAAGFLWIGVAGAALAAAAVPAVVASRVRTRIRQRAGRIDESLPLMLDGLAAALRAGASPAIAIDDVAVPDPLAGPVAAMRAARSVGVPVAGAVSVFADAAGTAHARLVAAALTVGIESGGDLPRVLDVLAQSARDRAALAREARVAGTQARLSAWVVASLPPVFLFVTGAASREQMHLLLHTPAGWALLGGGTVLEVAGLLWIRKVAV